MIKRIFMRALSNTLYFLGDLWSRTFLRFDCTTWTYPVYNRLMNWSCDISEKHDLDIWTETGGDDE